MLNKKNFLYATAILFLTTANVLASDAPQTFPKGKETGSNYLPNDMNTFGRLGDFIKPDSSLTVLNVEEGRYLSETEHVRKTKEAFLTVAPFDLHGMYRQKEYKYKTRISSSRISEPTIIVVPSLGDYSYSSIISKHPDTIILISAGNKSKSKPEAALSSYRKHTGRNIFHVGGTKGQSYIPTSLHPKSSKPGNYGYAYIADKYNVITTKNRRLYGTSFAVQIIGAKLAMLYKALNVNHKWTMVDAMQLLMTTRAEETYFPDLTKLLVRDENDRILFGENGETFLLSENKLRSRLKTSPLYSKGE